MYQFLLSNLLLLSLFFDFAAAQDADYLGHLIDQSAQKLTSKTHASCQESASCPEVILEQFSQANTNSKWAQMLPFLGEQSPRERCTASGFEKKFINDGSDLERHLELETNYALGSDFNPKQKMCSANGSQVDSLYLTGMKYVAAQRLQAGLKDNVTAIANIDRVLGQPIMSGVSCAGIPSQSAREHCELEKKCPQPIYSLDEMAERGVLAFKNIQQKQNKIADILQKKYKGQPLLAMKDEEVQKLESEQKLLRQLYPWMNGNQVRTQYSQLTKAQNISDDELKNKLKIFVAQDLTESRKQITQKLQDEQRAFLCLKAGATNCDGFQKTLSATQPLELESSDVKKMADNDRKSLTSEQKQKLRRTLEAQNVLSESQCIIEMTKLRDDAVRDAKLLAVDAGLAVAPFGAVKLIKYGWRGAATALAVNGSAATYYAAKSVSQNLDACAARLEREIQPLNAEGTNQCALNKNSAYLSAHYDYEACALSTIMTGAAIVPFGSLGLAARRLSRANASVIDDLGINRVRSRVQEIVKNEKVSSVDEVVAKNFKLSDPAREEKIRKSFPNFTDSQVKAAMEAHAIGAGGAGKYSKAELRKKLKVMQEAGIGAEDSELLMRLGLTGGGRNIRREFVGQNLNLERGQWFIEGRVYKRDEVVLVPRTSGGYSQGVVVGPSRQYPGQLVVRFGDATKSIKPFRLRKGFEKGEMIEFASGDKIRTGTVERINEDGTIEIITTSRFLKRKESYSFDPRKIRSADNRPDAGVDLPLRSGEYATMNGRVYRGGQNVTVEVSPGVYRSGKIMDVVDGQPRVIYSDGSSYNATRRIEKFNSSEIYMPFDIGDKVVLSGPSGKGLREGIVVGVVNDDEVEIQILNRFGPGQHGYKTVNRRDVWSQSLDDVDFKTTDNANTGFSRGSNSVSSAGPKVDPLAQESNARNVVAGQINAHKGSLNEQVVRRNFMNKTREAFERNPSDNRLKARYEELKRTVEVTDRQLNERRKELHKLYRESGGRLNEEEFWNSL